MALHPTIRPSLDRTRRGSRRALELSRRGWLRLAASSLAAGSLATTSVCRWFAPLAAHAAGDPARQRSCILLWMTGGPSQLETFDPKPGHENGGPTTAIETSVTGVQFAEHLPRMAERAAHLAVIRSMSTKEGDHDRATVHLRTGYPPGGPVQYPAMSALLGKELAPRESDVPRAVSIGDALRFSSAGFGAGFLGPEYAPLTVGATGLEAFMQGAAGDNDDDDGGDAIARRLKVRNLELPAGIDAPQFAARQALLDDISRDFARSRGGAIVAGHQAAYRRAVRMMGAPVTGAFNLAEEPDSLRDAYGRSLFGQGCLLARRLVERGVPFVEVTLSGADTGQAFNWDTHVNNFTLVPRLADVLDRGWSTLLDDLAARGLLESTLIVWMGEFGRTPRINNNQGRDHFPNAWSTVLAGGGIAGGQVVGRTSDDGMSVEDRPVSVPDLLATVVAALGLDPLKQNMSNVGRPIRVVDPEGEPVQECLA